MDLAGKVWYLVKVSPLFLTAKVVHFHLNFEFLRYCAGSNLQVTVNFLPMQREIYNCFKICSTIFLSFLLTSVSFNIPQWKIKIRHASHLNKELKRRCHDLLIDNKLAKKSKCVWHYVWTTRTSIYLLLLKKR